MSILKSAFPIILLDFEGFRDYNNQLFIKELGIHDVTNNITSCLTFQPPIYNSLRISNIQIQQTNKYIEQHIHGIPYNYGELEYNQVYDILSKYSSFNCILISKGNEKCEELTTYCNKYVYDLNSFSETCCKTYKPSDHISLCFNPHIKNNHCVLQKLCYYKALINHIKTH